MTGTRTRRAAKAEEEAHNTERETHIDSRHHSSEHKRQRSVSATEERKARKTSKRPRPRSSNVRSQLNCIGRQLRMFAARF